MDGLLSLLLLIVIITSVYSVEYTGKVNVQPANTL